LYCQITATYKKKPVKSLVRAWILFLFIFILYLTYGFHAESDEHILISNGLALLRFVVLYLLFKHLNYQSPIVRLSSLGVLLISFLLVFLLGESVYSASLELDQSYGLMAYFQIDYQTVAAAVLISVLILLDGRYPKKRFLIYVFAVYVLLGLGARFELIACIVVIFIRELKGGYALAFYSIILTLLLVVLTLFFEQSMSDEFDYLISRYRLFRIFEDESVSVRWEFFMRAIETISDNFFWGDYASYEPGSYAHNIISAWVDTGFLGFLVLLFIYIYAFILIMRFLIYRRTRLNGFAPMIIVVSILAALFAKHYTNLYLPVMVGSIVAFFSSRTENHITCNGRRRKFSFSRI